jgi:hypothetical protein
VTQPLLVGRRDVLVTTLWAVLLALFPWMRSERGVQVALQGALSIVDSASWGREARIRRRGSGVVRVSASVTFDAQAECSVRMVRQPDGKLLQEMALVPMSSPSSIAFEAMDQLPDDGEYLYEVQLHQCALVGDGCEVCAFELQEG